MHDIVQAMTDEPEGKGAGRTCPHGGGVQQVVIEFMKWNRAFDQGKIEFYLQFAIPVHIGKKPIRHIR